MNSTRRLIALFAVVLLLGACAGGGGLLAQRDGADQGGGGGGSGAAARAKGNAGGGASGIAAGYAEDADSAPMAEPEAAPNEASVPEVNQAPPIQGGPSVIKTALVQVTVERDQFRNAVQRATSTAERLGGYVVSTNVTDTEHGYASVTMRVPSSSFATALGGVRGLGEVKREEISGQDVTEELVDLAARIRHLRAQEHVLLDLMNDANTVSDTIRVQNQLSGVQLEIERLRGRLRFLDDQVAMSTITVEMRKAGADEPRELGTLGRAWQNAIGGFLAVVSGVIVAAGVALPIALLVVIVALAFRLLRPWVARKTGAAA